MRAKSVKLYSREGLIYLLITLTLLQPISTSAQSTPKTIDKDTYESLFKLGVANAEFFYLAFQTPPTVKVTSADMKVALQSAADAYKHSVESKRGAIGLLDTTAEVLLTGTDFASGGSTFVATVPIRWAKGLAIDGMINEIDRQATNLFAKNLDKIKTYTGMEYEALQKLTPEQKILQADKIPEIFALKSKLRGEGLATEVVDKLVVDTITSVQKATLKDIAQNSQDISNLGNGLESVTRAMAKYVKENNERLDDITTRLGNVEQGLKQAQEDIDDLKQKSANNTQQIRLIGDVLFSKADPQDRLTMLNGDYFKGRLSEDILKQMKTSLEAEIQKKEMIGKMNSLVSDFNHIGTIAGNLGIQIDGLDEAISIANVASSAIGAFATGNYLGAIAGVSGLFGKKVDANAKRHEQMMKYLQQQFAEVNRKLDQIIEGQQKIIEGIVELSKQMAEYDKALHQRLTRIEDKIDSLQNMTYSLLYMKMGDCSATYEFIREEIDILDSTRLRDLRKIDDYNAGRVFQCGEYLRSLYDSSFNPSVPSLESLALTNSSAPGTPASFKLPKEEVDKYYKDTAVQSFVKDYYRKTEYFVINRSKTLGWTASNLLGALTMPSGSVRGMNRKMAAFTPEGRACDAKSRLSDSLLKLTCDLNSRLDLPVSSSGGIENKANTNALRILDTPALYDATNNLAEWSLFFAPIYDVMEFSPGKKITDDYYRLIKKPSYRPSGKPLLQGAAKINAVALAQMNMIQGDFTAKLIFDLLWDKDKRKFLDDGEIISTEQMAAKEILSLQNPYLLRNVLMLALDSSSNVTGPYAYRQALETSETYTIDPFSGMRAVFGTGFSYRNLWEPIADTPSEDLKKACATATETQAKPKDRCSPIPTINLYGVDVPLPSVNEFVSREFIYPGSLKQMIENRDRLAARLAEYDFIEFAVKESVNKAEARTRIVDALLISTK
ncbi:MAG: hypothetical protein WBO10_03090 [Pyrinomonadaceae bacterium]